MRRTFLVVSLLVGTTFLGGAANAAQPTITPGESFEVDVPFPMCASSR